MNEQELFLRQKIEKREKFDTILAYVLIVILVGAILFILYLKFMREEEVKDPVEYVPNYISVSDISNSLNNSLLVSGYVSDGASFSSSVIDDNLVMYYVKDGNRIDIKANRVGNELEIGVNPDNSVVATDVYKEIANIVCVYYGSTDSDCRSIVNSIDENSSVDGIRFDKISDTNTKVYIDITKGLFVNNSSGIYTTPTNVGVDDTNYVVNMFDIEISNINVNRSDSDISFSGDLKRLTDNRSNFSVLVKLYDINGNEIKYSNQIFNEDNVMGESGTFNIVIVSDETFDLASVTEYSIEIVK